MSMIRESRDTWEHSWSKLDIETRTTQVKQETQHKDRVKDPKRTNLAQEENTKHTIDRHDQVPRSWRHKRQRERINRDMTEETGHD